ncbi:hypothetical protein LC20004_13230 [Loigolactobacillus coryniformis subsp. torquens DSM 20004 = KCTC 3535]|uniref:D-isomer specific 2-hydroxyacid dehydrogenase NAD-binding domain-containing protein n=1 Tax=Loigolactobacillus coryniformis subsp. torquens DSM 20004 = KCTC 3535 TaxID=1423822 RepID=A0A2D1KRS8_9LACO|nr:hypothetical protein LC20004_13230 [Loigolactobacillus coryniformis subsp. torquens DSM 20004 = KCTC 3535]
MIYPNMAYANGVTLTNDPNITNLWGDQLNTARGKLVNEADIRNALNEGKIYAYATDVVKGEPIASDSPLLQAKNCYITPHIAWAPYETRERLLHMTVDNIKAYLSGDLKNVIN